MNVSKANIDSARPARQYVAMFGLGGTLIGLLASHILHSPLMVIAGAAAGVVMGFVFAATSRDYTR